MQPRDLEGTKLGISDVIVTPQTIEHVIKAFSAVLDLPQQGSLKEEMKQTIRNAVDEILDLGEIFPTQGLYTDLINPFYRKYFGKDAPAFANRRVTYRLGN